MCTLRTALTGADALPGNDCGTLTPAHVISTSYGYNEADLSPAYTARQCAEYAKVSICSTWCIPF
jgi:tripeptidyl-peptidase-1